MKTYSRNAIQEVETSTAIIRPRMPELDSLRGVAVLMVLFYHGFFWSNTLQGLTGVKRIFVSVTSCGWLGVNLFFVLSGFLITGILIDSRLDPHYFRKFYVRRALRILPAFYALLVLLAFNGFRGHYYLLSSFFYLSNLTPLWGVAMTYPMLWSLAVEEHFYLVWPALLRKLSANAIPKLVLAIVIAEPILRMMSFLLGRRTGLSYYTWLVADGLALGAALAFYFRQPHFSRHRVAQISIGLVTLACLMASFGTPYGIFTRQRLLGSGLQLTMFNLLFAGLLGITLLLGTSRYRFLVNRPGLVFFGNISYGLYLIHWMVFAWYDRFVSFRWPGSFPIAGRFGLMTLRFAIVSAVAVLIACMSRRYFEEPFLQLKERFAEPVAERASGTPVQQYGNCVSEL
jgi:peptidoglycan/LPS O-acetylase OafA/YrhL